MPREFYVGQQVMVRQKYSSRDNPSWSQETIRRPDVVKIESHSFIFPDSWQDFDPSNPRHKGLRHYVGVGSEPTEVTCSICAGDGKVMDTIPLTFDYESGEFIPEHEGLVECHRCEGKGYRMSQPYIEYYLNTKQYVLTIEEYESTIGKEKREREIQRANYEQKRQEQINNFLDEAVERLKNADDLKHELADLIYTEARAYSVGNRVVQGIAVTASENYIKNL